jgi:hypothetical protein
MILTTNVIDTRAQYLVMSDELLLLLFLKAFGHVLDRYTSLQMLDVFIVCTAAEPAVASAHGSNSQIQTAPRQTRPRRGIIAGDCQLLLCHVTAL